MPGVSPPYTISCLSAIVASPSIVCAAFSHAGDDRLPVSCSDSTTPHRRWLRYVAEWPLRRWLSPPPAFPHDLFFEESLLLRVGPHQVVENRTSRWSKFLGHSSFLDLTLFPLYYFVIRSFVKVEFIYHVVLFLAFFYIPI